MKTVAAHDPAESKPYTFDFTPLMDVLGDTISSITSVTPDAGLTTGSDTIDSTSKKVTTLVSGGTAGTDYKVACLVQTANGYTLKGTMIIPCRTK